MTKEEIADHLSDRIDGTNGRITEVDAKLRRRLHEAEETISSLKALSWIGGIILALVIGFGGKHLIQSRKLGLQDDRTIQALQQRNDSLVNWVSQMGNEIGLLQRHGRITHENVVASAYYTMKLTRRDSGYVFVDGRETAKADGTYSHTEKEYMDLLKELQDKADAYAKARIRTRTQIYIGGTIYPCCVTCRVVCN